MAVRTKTIVGGFFAAIGTIVVLSEVAMHFVAEVSSIKYEMNHVVLLVGAILGFVGFFMLDRKGAEEGGGFLVNSATRIIGVIRTGRRSDDIAVVVDDPTGVIPAAPLPTGANESIPPAPPAGTPPTGS